MDLHVPPAADLLALGEPTHQEPAFQRIRNDLFATLAGRGFSSIALESDRVAAFAVDDYVRHVSGTLDGGFSHTLETLAGNQELVAWMRSYNDGRPPHEQLSFHGFDASTEMMSAPSPRWYLEQARDYLGLDLDIAALAGEDERWSRTEAVLSAASSVGATPAAAELRVLADTMLTALHARAPELIAAGSRLGWFRVRTCLTAGVGLLRYHHQAAQDLPGNTRISLMSGVRDVLMAQNLLDIRDQEAGRGPTLVFAHNLHLKRTPSVWTPGDLELRWSGAGSILAPLIGDRYHVVVGSLGRSDALGLGEPAPGTYESLLRPGVTPAADVPAARTRTDTRPEQGYFPLDAETLAGADAVLHLSDTP